MNKIYWALVSLGVAVFAAGCGGSKSTPAAGGVTLPTGAIKITQTNANKVASTGATSGKGADRAGGSAGDSATNVVAQSSSMPTLSEIALKKFSKFRSLQGIPLASSATGVVGVVLTDSATGLPYPTTTACANVGGSTKEDAIDDGDGILGLGDKIVTTDTNCIDSALPTITTNGTLTMAINSLAIDPTTLALNFDISMTFTSYTEVDSATQETLTTSGDMNLVIADDGTTMTITMTGSQLTATSSIDGVFGMKAYTLISTIPANPNGIYTDDWTFTTSSVDLGGEVTVSTPTPLTSTGATGNVSGVMQFVGLNNSTLTVTINNDVVTESVDEDGSGTANAAVDVTPTGAGADWDTL